MISHQRYIVRPLAILAFQGAMVAALVYFDSSPHQWIPSLFAIVAMLVPLVGYVAAFYHAPLFGQWSRTLKTSVLILASIIVTMACYTLLLLAGLFCKGDTDRTSLAASEPGVCICGFTNWTRFSPEGGGFSVLMPFRPTQTTSTNNTPYGHMLTTIFMAEPSRVVAFSVFHSRFPPEIDTSNKDKLFEAALKSALGADGMLISDKHVQLHGYEGHEWQFHKIKGKALISMRMYLVRHSLYQAICLMPRNQPCPRHSQEFLDSFDLTDNPKNEFKVQ
jgi:hypothetical protein